MAILRRRTIDNTIEDKILTGMVISTKFCREIERFYKKEYLSTIYTQIIAKWCIDYYKQYKECPSKKIQDIFYLEKQNLKESDAEIISAFLSKLSDQIEQEESFNEEYILDKSKEYFKKKALLITIDNVKALLEFNKIDDAEKEIQKHKNIIAKTNDWIDPFLEKEIKIYFQDEQKKSKVLFRMPGALGNLIGDFERDWLFAVFAPVKRGKSFWLQEIAIQAVLEGRKTIMISLEMGDHSLKRRLYKRLIAQNNQSKTFIYPCFDCIRNQNGSCQKSIRTNNIKLIDESGDKPEYDEKMKYKPCTECRGNKDFIVGSWYSPVVRDKMELKTTLKKIKGLKNSMLKDYFKIKSYPAFSANLSQIKADIEELENINNFIPDVIVIDYPDILAPEDNRVVGRERIDDTWKTLKNLASTRHCLIVVASQTNRGSFDKRNVTQIDAAEDIRKFAHVDGAVAINQLPNEKRENIVRIALIAERDGEFDQYKSCLVLQQLELGQVYLDSELIK